MHVEDIDSYMLLTKLVDPPDYSVHRFLHGLTQNIDFETQFKLVGEDSGIYQLLKVFANNCDLAMGRIASALNNCPSSPFHKEDIISNCKIVVSILTG